jgi:N-acetylneuraminate synthase
VDAAFSLEPPELKLLVEETERAFLSLGKVQLGIQPVEEKSRQFNRSLFLIKDIKAGEVFSETHIRSFRPAIGLETKYFDQVVGRTAKNDLKAGTPVTWDILF